MTPATVDELRAAVERVSAARGESLRVTCDRFEGRYFVAINNSRWCWIEEQAPDLAESIGKAWGRFVHDAEERVRRAEKRVDEYRDRLAEARASAAEEEERLVLAVAALDVARTPAP